MAAPKKTINLLVQSDFEHSTAGKILTWLTTTGRIIAIIAELVVIIAFISTFWLDKTLSDLSESNASKKTQIEAALPFEEQFRSAQQRLSLVKQIEAKQEKAGEEISTITSYLPIDINLTSISVADGKLTIQGDSLSEAGIAQLMTALDASKQFANTTLTNISLENKGQQTITFKISSDVIQKKE